jgi:hypothetical protein
MPENNGYAGGAGDQIGDVVTPSASAMSRLLDGIPLGKGKQEEPEKKEPETPPTSAPVEPKKEPVKAQEPEKEPEDDGLGDDDTSKEPVKQPEPAKQPEGKKEPEKKEPEQEVSIIDEFQQKYGVVELPDGEKFDESTEGLMDYFDAVLPSIRTEAKREGIGELFEQAPILGELAQHLADGYGFDSFRKKFEAFDYSKLEVKEDDTKLQEQLYRDALKVKGTDPDDIEELVNGAKDGGKLFERANKAKDYLDKQQQAQIAEIQKQEKAANEAFVKQQQETIKEIDGILKTGKIAGLPFDPTKITSLKQAYRTVDNKGVSALQEKWNNLTLEQQILLDMIVNNDFKDLGVKITPGTKVAKSLVDLKKKSNDAPKVDMNKASGGGDDQTGGIKKNFKSFLQGADI